MELSTGQMADLERLKDKFKLTASQNLEEYTSGLLALLHQSKQYEEKSTQVYHSDFFTIDPSSLQTNYSVSEDLPLNLVIEESTDSEQPSTSPRMNNVSPTKKRTMENDYSERNGFVKNVKKEKLDDDIISHNSKKLKTNSVENSEINDSVISVNNNVGNRNVEKYLRVVRHMPSNGDKLENQTEKSKQQDEIKDLSVRSKIDYIPSLKKGETNGRQKVKILSPDDDSNKQACKLQSFSKSNYVLQPTGDKFHKFSIINLSCPIEDCFEVLLTQSEMNHHLNLPHPYNTYLYHCPIKYCSKPFKNRYKFFIYIHQLISYFFAFCILVTTLFLMAK